MNRSGSVEIDEKVSTGEDVDFSKSYHLIVHNDHFNTFENVIITLIEVCEHTAEQAEQCTWIIHFKGKCSVKEGSFDNLRIMQEKIASRGITATVEFVLK